MTDSPDSTTRATAADEVLTDVPDDSPPYSDSYEWQPATAASDGPFVNVKKVSHQAQVSRELLMDYGLIPDDRPPFVPTRRQRFRWWRQERLRRARMRLASWIAGFDVEDSW